MNAQNLIEQQSLRATMQYNIITTAWIDYLLFSAYISMWLAF